ncbi:rod shape-determining protein MreC [Limibacter armeniacum]|uniref:rod shape-determining protein MreC n=1 Tax=Limibacter armeniacum TaxID=466084 RepID=UPI002FE65232
MQELFAFIYRFRVMLVFVLLEGLCTVLIINNNSYQRAVFFTSANRVVGGLFQTTTNVKEYFTLREVNTELMDENARLRRLLSDLNEHNTMAALEKDSLLVTDSLFVKADDSLNTVENFDFIPAEIINNSVLRTNNYITINRGRKDGVRPGMGIITSDGVVGQVKAASNHFATCYSILHSSMAVSAQVKKNGALCTTIWNAEQPDKADVKYVARHLDVVEGDTIITSGYNAVYPEGIVVGVVSKVEKLPSERFLQVEMKLSVDFTKLSYVYVVNSLFRNEKDSLEEESMVE